MKTAVIEKMDFYGEGMTEEEAKRNVLRQVKETFPTGAMILNCENSWITRQPKSATKCSTDQVDVPGTKKWVTKYKLLLKNHSGDCVFHPKKFDTQAEALKLAKEIVIQKQCIVALQVEKILEGQSDTLKIVSPKNIQLGEWGFSLEVAYKDNKED